MTRRLEAPPLPAGAACADAAEAAAPALKTGWRARLARLVPSEPAHEPWFVRLARRALGWLSAALEWCFGDRGLRLAYLGLVVILLQTAWLRPAVSPDLHCTHLPLGARAAVRRAPEEFLQLPRKFRPTSPGALILAVAAAGAVVACWRPRWFWPVPGLLLALGLVANAAFAFNHPTLIERLDFEYEQRTQLASLISNRALAAPPMSNPGSGRVKGAPTLNGRVSASATRDQEWGSWDRGWYYLMYGLYFVGVAALAVLAFSPGSLSRRLALLGLWLVGGVALAGLACQQRLRAEYHWAVARRHEADGRYEPARRSLERAEAIYPEFGRLQRTCILAGRIDYRTGQQTPRERFFRTHQLSFNREWARGLYTAGEVYRESPDAPAVRALAARVYTDYGRSLLDNNRLMAAVDATRRAGELEPGKPDVGYYLGSLLAQADRDHPGPVQQALAPLTDKATADRGLRADAGNALGNAYFEAGQMTPARRHYADSNDAYHLPRVINLYSMKGLGGQ